MRRLLAEVECAAPGAAAPAAAPQPGAVPRSLRADTGQRAFDPASLPPALLRGCAFRGAADGLNENLLLLFHGLGDTPAPFDRLAGRLALPQTASLALAGKLPGTVDCELRLNFADMYSWPPLPCGPVQ